MGLCSREIKNMFFTGAFSREFFKELFQGIRSGDFQGNFSRDVLMGFCSRDF